MPGTLTVYRSPRSNCSTVGRSMPSSVALQSVNRSEITRSVRLAEWLRRKLMYSAAPKTSFHGVLSYL
ncbi:hypothetical protein D3C85_1618520 [compost metagenome]